MAARKAAHRSGPAYPWTVELDGLSVRRRAGGRGAFHDRGADAEIDIRCGGKRLAALAAGRAES